MYLWVSRTSQPSFSTSSSSALCPKDLRIWQPHARDYMRDANHSLGATMNCAPALDLLVTGAITSGPLPTSSNSLPPIAWLQNTSEMRGFPMTAYQLEMDLQVGPIMYHDRSRA